MSDAQVLIVGAGPTGLVLALWLTHQGVSVRIIDKVAEPGTTSRALAVHARTLELYRQMHLDQAVVEKGYTVPGARMWLGGKEEARVPFSELVSGLTPYGFLHIFPQDEHERLLIARLEELGIRVERQVQLVRFEETGEKIAAQLRGANGVELQISADFIAGCDGASSKVREIMGTGFPGGTYSQIFYVADVQGSGPAFNGDLNVELDQSDFLAIFPLAHKERIRLIGAIRPDEGKDLGKLTFDDIKDRAAQSLRLKVDKVNWFSTYLVHHRVTDHFRTGRAFLLGDAAHIHTPVGGQGMNTGIGDAINLAWKLKAVLTGRASADLPNTYESERRAFALRLVKTTDFAFNFVARDGWIAEIVRTRVAPVVLPQMVSFDAVREYIFRTISQITLKYRDKGLDEGHAGSVHGGERLPWVKFDNTDNYVALEQMAWNIHVYGQAEPHLRDWCRAHNILLHVYAWRDAFGEAGLAKDAVYLIRPDSYVGLAQTEQDTAKLSAYFDRCHLKL